MKKVFVIWLAIFLAGSLAACGGSKETTLSDADREAVLYYSEAKTDNLVAGMKAGDYAVFSQDFDQAMKNAMSAEQFVNLKKDRDAKLGPYVSRQVNKVTQSGDFIAVVYDTVFEKDEAVTMRVVFRAAEPHEISGLWFNK